MNSVPKRTTAKAPQQGSFPLDHLSECTMYFQIYRKCLQKNEFKNHLCKHEAKAYLECRMENQLMADQDLGKMGFSEQHIREMEARKDDTRHKKEAEGFIAGAALVAAKRRQQQKDKKDSS